MPQTRSEKMTASLHDRMTLTVPQAAELAGVPVKIVRAAAIHGDLATFTIGSTTMRIKRTDLDQWVQSL